MVKRAIRIANCSGAYMDSPFQMYRQCTSGPIDAVTGDWLAELNIAARAETYKTGQHPGWEINCEKGILMSLEVLNQSRIKCVVNGGAQNPKGLAELVFKEVQKNNYNLKVAYIAGDNLEDRLDDIFTDNEDKIHHFDGSNEHVKLDKLLDSDFTKMISENNVVSANAYLGSRGIQKALNAGADIIICGRVSDASPVIGLCAWWHGWEDTDYDKLACSLIAGHLIECSGYSTGANFSDFDKYPKENLIDLGYPIIEVEDTGSIVITKHDTLNGLINLDIIRSHFLYELQGEAYLNSDVIAHTGKISIHEIGKNRVKVTGIKGSPPPPTTKFAVFYKGGYELQLLIFATGNNAHYKFDLQKSQILHALKTKEGVRKPCDEFDVLEFQILATPAVPTIEHPFRNQNSATSLMRIFAQSTNKGLLEKLNRAMNHYAMQHFAGFCNMPPGPISEYLAYFPCIIPQSYIEERAIILNDDLVLDAGIAPNFKEFGPRVSYESETPLTQVILDTKFGPVIESTLDTFVQTRSGDKGANVNIGLFVKEEDEYEWLKSYFTKDRLRELVYDDWKDDLFTERVQFDEIKAVHFVIYGILGRGVSSSSRIDNLGKAFGEFVRAQAAFIPKKFVDRYAGTQHASFNISH